MNAETFNILAEYYTAIPVYRRMLADTLTPVSLFLSIRSNSRHPFLFESVEGGEHLARYSFLGCNPYQTLTFDGESTWLDRKGRGPEKMKGSYLDRKSTRLNSSHVANSYAVICLKKKKK